MLYFKEEGYYCKYLLVFIRKKWITFSWNQWQLNILQKNVLECSDTQSSNSLTGLCACRRVCRAQSSNSWVYLWLYNPGWSMSSSAKLSLGSSSESAHQVQKKKVSSILHNLPAPQFALWRYWASIAAIQVTMTAYQVLLLKKSSSVQGQLLSEHEMNRTLHLRVSRSLPQARNKKIKHHVSFASVGRFTIQSNAIF